MINSTVKVFDHFDEIGDEIDEFARYAVWAAAAEAGATAAAIGGARGMTDFAVSPARGDIEGYIAGIKGAHWYWRLQSFGTLGRAIRPKRPGHIRSHAPGTGITPNGMYQAARLNGRRKLLEVLARGPGFR